MEFHEKLQELRKQKGITQEELAAALFVSRTAVSKWESGRGYPNIDSLRALSRYFSVTLDELIGSEEMLTAAEDEKKSAIEKYLALICGAIDLLLATLFFLPIFGDGKGLSTTLFSLSGIEIWIKIVFIGLIGLSALNGLAGVIVSYFEKALWNKHRIATGLALSILGSAVFLMTRQPYAGILYFVILLIKGLLIFKSRDKL
ncbi:MAG: helix-turn-helix transcriptional regulator [Clostridia bacterium]|nr:helix-turn-helix transcriptional regulator [Clostridia bacterium]